MNYPKISVIVPVYNTEKYLYRCIDSILAQSFTDFELLLIDDGSKDNSGKICDEYADKDKRIRVIHKVNTGVSDTRNRGLDIAQGKYIIFIDADDYWYNYTALEKLVETAEKHNLDIVRGEYKAVDEDGNDLFERPLTKSKEEYSGKVLTSGLFYKKIMCGENFLFLSLIRRNAISNLRFNKERSFLEDMEFYANLLLKPLRCMFVPMRFYAYRKTSYSASHIPKIKNLADSFSMCDIFHECEKRTKDKEMQNAFHHNSIMMYYWTLDTVSSDFFYHRRKEIIKDLKLNSLRKRVCVWIASASQKYSCIFYLIPQWGIFYFRVRHFMGNKYHRIKRLFNRQYIVEKTSIK